MFIVLLMIAADISFMILLVDKNKETQMHCGGKVLISFVVLGVLLFLLSVSAFDVFIRGI